VILKVPGFKPLIIGITNLTDNTVYILLLGDANCHGQKGIATSDFHLHGKEMQGLEKIPTSKSYPRKFSLIQGGTERE
jgi:hypothetical protein